MVELRFLLESSLIALSAICDREHTPPPHHTSIRATRCARVSGTAVVALHEPHPVDAHEEDRRAASPPRTAMPTGDLKAVRERARQARNEVLRITTLSRSTISRSLSARQRNVAARAATRPGPGRLEGGASRRGRAGVHAGGAEDPELPQRRRAGSSSATLRPASRTTRPVRRRPAAFRTARAN